MPRGSAPKPTQLGLAISRLIDEACGHRGRSAAARKAGIGRARFDDLASGNRTWYLSELEAVCDALGLDIVAVVRQATVQVEPAVDSVVPPVFELPRPSTGEHDALDDDDLLEVADESPDEDVLRAERGEW